MPAERACALLANMTERDVALLPLRDRARLAELCARWAAIALKMNEAPRSGVLYELRTKGRPDR